MMNKKLFIFAGEQSGDLHGGHLAIALKKQQPKILIEGVTGPNMRLAGVQTVCHMEEFEVMGITDVLLALPRLCKNFYKIRHHILTSKPNGVILIDYPGFNLRLATSLRAQGYAGKIIQYISPTVWAHGKHRIDTMAKSLDLLLIIFPFESKCYEATTLPVTFVGNPLCDYLKDYTYDEAWRSKWGLPDTDELIALFPGSRQAEITRNLPMMLETAHLIKQKHPHTLFAISCASAPMKRFLENHLSNVAYQGLRSALFLVPKEFNYELMRDSRSAMAKSGTVTLELALHRRPTIVIYKLTPLNRFYAKYVLKLNLPHYCLVNILSGKEVFPELIAQEADAIHLMHQFLSIHEEGDRRQSCLLDCHEISESLKNHSDASVNAAKAIEKLIC